MKLIATSLVLMAVIQAGCSSLNSTYIGDDRTTGKTFTGMPIVVQRPKYLKVTYKKVTYQAVGKRTEPHENVAGTRVETLGEARTVDEISTEIVSVGEVYALDLKRPAAGSNDYAVEFDAGVYYPKKVGAKIEDKTIEAMGSFLGEILKQGAEVFKPAAAEDVGVPAEVLKIAESVVKVELRSLEDPSKVYQVFP